MPHPKRLEMKVHRSPRSLNLVRRWIESLEVPLTGDRRDDLVLATTELVTNSVLHADEGDEVIVGVSVLPDTVRVEVQDGGSNGTVAPARGGLLDTSGRGLMIVAELASRWGVHETNATEVWFEIERAS